MRTWVAQLSLALIAVIIGVTLVAQFRSQSRPTELSSLSVSELSTRIQTLSDGNRQPRASIAAQGARLILFPEAFIPCYPRGLGFGTVVGSRTTQGRRTFQAYWDGAVDVPGPATMALGEAARRARDLGRAR